MHHEPKRQTLREDKVPHGSGAHRSTDSALITQLLRDNLTIWTLVEEDSQGRGAETAQDEIADKAKEPNADTNKVKESALDQTKRRLELWNQSTSRKLMIQALPTRVCSITAETTVPEKGASGVTAAKSPGRKLQSPGIQQHRYRAAAVPSSRAEKL